MTTPSYLPTNALTAFLSTAQVYPEEQSELLITLTDIQTETANAVNLREIGQYDLVEVLNGQFFFTVGDNNTKRLAYRKVFYLVNANPLLPAIAIGATSTTAHGITGETFFTRISATAVTDVVDYRPIPYASATLVTDQIEIKVDATNITIINGATSQNLMKVIVVLEYLKS